MMEAIDPETSELHIKKLKSILGDDWCKNQLADYQRFREYSSPTDLWSHRYPNISPIVPLLYHHENVKDKGDHPPLGHWYGDPIHYLKQLAAAVFMFEDYWSQLPDNMGMSNIQYKLTNADQFNGFVFELLVAVDSKVYTYANYTTEPSFFDPKAAEGGADIIVKKGTEEIAIQCKTRNPLAALDMSFDMFHYVFGCFYRLVCDSGYSYKITLNVKRKLENADISRLLEVLRGAIKAGLEIPKHAEDNAYDIKLSRLDIAVRGISSDAIHRLLAREKANLFTEIGGFSPYGKQADRFNRVAILSVSASRRESIEKSIVNIVSRAAREARVNGPLILAIHLFEYIEWETYLGSVTNQKSLDNKLDPILKSYPNIKSISVSSNRQQYVDIPDGAQIIRTPYLKIPNKYFAA